MSNSPSHVLKKVREAKIKGSEFLDLSPERRWKISQIPTEVFELRQLKILKLNGNQLRMLPEEIGQLTNLIQLDLQGNQLTTLPESIGNLINLSDLYLDRNQLTTLPESIGQLTRLVRLDLRHNHLTALPQAIARLKGLSYFAVDNNPLESPPIEVAQEGITAMTAYFQQLEEQGVDYLYEAKLLIVGEPGAGKTSLARKIENPNYELRPVEKSTEGIDILRWRFPLSPQKNFRVNIWDFGGQEIYHATHQFFLTKRSLYILVADTRREDTDFHYWLNAVELLSNNSPLLIVKNEKQGRRREINERQLRGQFTSLKETLAIDLATNRGLDELLSRVDYYINHLPHVGDKLPRTWLKVREVIENDSRNYISLDEYLAICRKNGFKESRHMFQLSSYLHDLGVCLHFQDDPILKNIIILKPNWGTDAVYRVLDNKQVVNNLGRFTRQDLVDIWGEDKYFAKHDELLQLMMKFQLCYQLPGSKDIYIAPQLLTENQPKYNWRRTNNLILKYTYEFMPKGIIIRFIVMMHALMAGQQYVWKNGIILKKDETAAEVIENYGKREITIRVLGKHKRDLLTIITHELDKIHADYKRLKYNKLIPCNCQVCKNVQEPHFYSFESLRRRIAGQKYEIECDISFRMVNILSLIDDVGERSIISDRQGTRENYMELDQEMVSSEKHLVRLIQKNRQRLQILQEKWATLGISSPPEVRMEIEDIKNEIEGLETQLKELKS